MARERSPSWTVGRPGSLPGQPAPVYFLFPWSEGLALRGRQDSQAGVLTAWAAAESKAASVRGWYSDQCDPEDVDLGHRAGQWGALGFPAQRRRPAARCQPLTWPRVWSLSFRSIS